MKLIGLPGRVERDILERKYKSVLARHYDLMAKYEEAYKSKRMEKTIELCKQDIALVPKLSEYWDGLIRLGDLKSRAMFPGYKRLAIVYEKQGRIAEAVKVCEDAIRAGYSDDGTSGGMEGRLKKLLAKV